MRTHRYNAPSNPDRRSTRKGVGAPDRFALLAKMAEADRDRNGSRTDWKRYAFLLADGRHKHPLAGAAIRARTPSELDGHSVDCQSGPRVGVEARIRRSNSADRQRVYGWTVDGESIPRKSLPRRIPSGCWRSNGLLNRDRRSGMRNLTCEPFGEEPLSQRESRTCHEHRRPVVWMQSIDRGWECQSRSCECRDGRGIAAV